MHIVPWFSREEWLETYQAAFSDDVYRWKDAKDTMLVWQARVEKLPVGIDVMLPLLQAKIVEADPTMEASIKCVCMAAALQRFVTSIVKLPQSKYYRAQSMHSLAEKIDLPQHLIDLRNEIVHGHGGWSGGETVRRGLEEAYVWIKGYYWDIEFQKIQKSYSESGVPAEEWQELLSLLGNYAKFALCSASRKVTAFNKIKEKVIKNLEPLYAEESEECVKAVVSLLLVPEPSSSLATHLGKVDVCECGCCIDAHFLKGVKPLLDFFCGAEEGIDLLVLCLIKKGQNHTKLSSEWLCLICGALLDVPCFSSEETHCSDHSLVLEEPLQRVDWKRIVIELLSMQAEWATDIGMRIIESPKSGITTSQKEKIEELLNAACTTACTNSKEDEEVYSVASLLSAITFLPLCVRRKLERLSYSITGQHSDADNVETRLGVLPGQDNSLLYKELVLNMPDTEVESPPAKRPKLLHSLS